MPKRRGDSLYDIPLVMSTGRFIQLKHFLTAAEIDKLVGFWNDGKPEPFSQRACAEVIQPVLERINTALGQANDPMYLAYMVEYALTKIFGPRRSKR